MNNAHREMVSGLTHFIGAILAIIGASWLIILTLHDLPKLITIIIFGISMVLLYLASTAMHLLSSFKGSEHPLVRLLQRVDHSAIYIMIAGCYTPLTYNLPISPEWRGLVLGSVWTLALAGVIMKIFFFSSNYLSTVFYVGMGWLGVIVAPQALPLIDPRVLWLIVGGGIIYTVGAVIYALHKPNLHTYFGSHELWHLFVMAGTTCHFVAVAWYVV